MRLTIHSRAVRVVIRDEALPTPDEWKEFIEVCVFSVLFRCDGVPWSLRRTPLSGSTQTSSHSSVAATARDSHCFRHATRGVFAHDGRWAKPRASDKHGDSVGSTPAASRAASDLRFGRTTAQPLIQIRIESAQKSPACVRGVQVTHVAAVGVVALVHDAIPNDTESQPWRSIAWRGQVPEEAELQEVPDIACVAILRLHRHS